MDLSQAEAEKMMRDIIPTIVTRDEWGAKRAKKKKVLPVPVKRIVYCTTNTNPCYSKEHCTKVVKFLQDKHMEEGEGDIKHNFLIGSDGNVYEGRGWTTAPADVQDANMKEINDGSLQVAFIGHEETKPSRTQIKRALGLMVLGIQNKFVAENVGIFQADFKDAIFPDIEGEEDYSGKNQDNEDEENLSEDDWGDDEENKKEFDRLDGLLKEENEKLLSDEYEDYSEESDNLNH